jgi:MFS family permease
MGFPRDMIPPRGIVRLLALSNLAKTTARGVIISISVLYFTRMVGIAPEMVGLALTVGALVGMLSSVPAGRLADFRGPRPVTVIMLMLLAVAACGYALVHSFVTLTLTTTFVIGLESAANAARGALLAGLLPPAERTGALAHMRSTANIGVAAGAAAGGVGLLINSHAGYIGLLLTAGALYAVSGLAFLRVPSVPAVSEPKGASRWQVLRDRPFAAVSLVNSVLAMNDALLVVGLPVWISRHTTAPPAFFTVLLLVNTTAVVLLQVPLSRGTEDIPGGARAWRRAGWALAASCAVFALAEGQPAWLACVILLAGTLVHVVGEMLYGAGTWSLSYGLAPESAQGRYQGLFGMSTQLGTTVAPFAVTALLTAFNAAGLLVWCVVFLIAGHLARPLTQWAERTRSDSSVILSSVSVQME